MSKSKLLTALLVAVSVMFLTTPVLSDEGYKVSYTAEFSVDDLSFDKLLGFDVVTLKDGGYLSDLGKPMLPSKELKIALPYGMAVTTVQVVNTMQEEISGEYNVFPAQPPIKIGASPSDAGFVKPDGKIYASTQPYPTELLYFVHQTDLAGQGMAVVQLYPLQYVPSEKRLILHTSITFVIEGIGGYEYGDHLSPNISERGRNTYQRMIEEMVVNPEDVRLNTAVMVNTSTVLEGGPFDHVIITSSTYASYFDPLVEWHNQKGIRDTVVSTSWIYANYSGTTNKDKIRSFVNDAHSTWGTTYFFLGGEDGTVPFEFKTYYDESTPSDQCYSDYDGDWTHEVFVGRATIQSSTEADRFIDKVLKYEKDPPRTDYPLDVLLIGMDLDPSTHAEYLKEAINNSIPSRFNVTKVYDSDGTNHKTATINALNAGQNLVNHADHAYYDYMGTGDRNHGWGINSSNVDALTNNDQLSVVVSLGCDPNGMDHGDCISEHFVIYNDDQAGVSFTGNTRSGWGYVGNPYSLSGKLDWEWWKALFDRDKLDLGQILADSKHYSPNGQPIERHCEWTFNLLGEPAMPIWTDDPDSFAVTCPSVIPGGGSSFSVHAEDSTTHFPVDSAYVCLWKANEVYLTGYTDASGDVTLNPSPATQGSMYVTVTKHNYIPHQQQVEVSYLPGDANADGLVDIADVVHLMNYLFTEGSPPSPFEAGDANCDEEVDIADVIYLINYLFGEGSPPGC